MDAPELTIGIPTYNGQMFLSSVLEGILSEARGKNVEVLIMDNASTDRTPNIANDFQSRYPDTVHYVRNERNVGFDGNVDRIIRQAKGRYVWFLADDDYLQSGAVEKVLTVIRENPDLAMIFANFSNWIDLGLDHDVLCRDGNEFFTRDQFKNGLISSNIVNRQVWLDLDMQRFDGCLWIHFAYSVQAMAPKDGRKGYVIAQELVRQGGLERWGTGGSSLQVGLKLVQLFSGMEELGYSHDVKRKGDLVIKGRYVREISWAKVQGLKVDSKLFGQMRTAFGSYPSFWLVDVPMLLVPRFVYRTIFNIFYAKKKRSGDAERLETADRS
jgi:glycosyltransferase involved in cell wall biosynthesis